MRIHKEGYKILTISLMLFTVIFALSWFAMGPIALIISIAILLPLYIFMLRFFRVPSRTISVDEDKILSPCDGKVVAIEEVYESEYLNSKCIQISVFMSVWNVHINWYPVGGKVAYSKYHPGKFLVAWEPKSSTLNERTTVAVESNNGAKVLFRQIAGFVARRIICTAKVGNNVKQADEVGFIKFGSRVDVLLPLSAKVKVELNQKVTGTQSVLAVLQN
ncbi:MAG: phosphatidylserine decarboxylase family protein [Bacteroidales bacterium]